MEFKVGEWYEQWNLVCGHPELPRTLDRMRCIAVDVREIEGSVVFVTEHGDLCWLETDENIKHLPGCDGWDWKPVEYPLWWKAGDHCIVEQHSADRVTYHEVSSGKLDSTRHNWPNEYDGKFLGYSVITVDEARSWFTKRRESKLPQEPVKQSVPTGWTQVGGIAGGMLWFAPDDSEPASEVAPISARVENTAESELWRELEVGETICEGDQYWKHGFGPWQSTTLNTYRPGKIEKFHAKHRRRVRVESPGWRYLDEGETVVFGDEFRCFGGCWKPANQIGSTVADARKRIDAPKDACVCLFRRKISPG